MREKIDWKKYLVWAAIAAACVLVDVGFFFALGGAVKWMAGLASPVAWAGLATIGILAARIVQMLDRVQVLRGSQIEPRS